MQANPSPIELGMDICVCKNPGFADHCIEPYIMGFRANRIDTSEFKADTDA